MSILGVCYEGFKGVVMNEPDRTWLRSLPLLLSSGVLMLAGSYAFFIKNDDIASVAAFAAALMLLGAWVTTAVIDWYNNIKKQGVTDTDGEG